MSVAYGEIGRVLHEARDRQVQLKQALEDLALANKETLRLNEMLSLARKAVEESRKAKEEFVKAGADADDFDRAQEEAALEVLLAAMKACMQDEIGQLNLGSTPPNDAQLLAPSI